METLECRSCGQTRRNRGRCKSCGERLCSICREALPFGRTTHRCTTCEAEYQRTWRAENPEKSAAIQREWRASNPERSKAIKHRWADANKDQIKEKGRRRRAENPEKSSAASRRWGKANPSLEKEASRKWVKNNPDRVKDKDHRRRARKIGCLVSKADIAAIIKASGGLCNLCRTFVPEDLRHVDHIVPLAKGGPHSTANLQLLCRRCNQTKSAKMPEDVTPETWVAKPNPLQPFLLNPNWK